MPVVYLLPCGVLSMCGCVGVHPSVRLFLQCWAVVLPILQRRFCDSVCFIGCNGGVLWREYLNGTGGPWTTRYFSSIFTKGLPLRTTLRACSG